MSDIVERLQGAYSTVFERSMAKEAADEIERLRAHIALLDGDVDREVKRAERAETALKELDKDLAGMGGAVLSWRDAASRDREAKERAEAALRECLWHANAMANMIRGFIFKTVERETLAEVAAKYRKWEEDDCHRTWRANHDK